MRNYLCLFVFLVCWGWLSACAVDVNEIITVTDEIDENANYPEIKEWFEYMCSEELGGRYSGSKGIEKAADFIVNLIGESDSLEIDLFETDKCLMKNIIFHVKGESDSLIVLGAHYDAYGYKNNTPYPGADDNFSGVAVLLQIIKAIQNDFFYPKYSIDICLFDGEEIGRYGSYHFLSKCENGIALYINVDTCGGKDTDIRFFYSPSLQLLNYHFEDFLESTNLPVVEYDPVGYTTDCEPFQKKAIPFVAIGCYTLPSYLHTIDDNIGNISFRRLDTYAKAIEKNLEII